MVVTAKGCAQWSRSWSITKTELPLLHYEQEVGLVSRLAPSTRAIDTTELTMDTQVNVAVLQVGYSF